MYVAVRLSDTIVRIIHKYDVDNTGYEANMVLIKKYDFMSRYRKGKKYTRSIRTAG